MSVEIQEWVKTIIISSLVSVLYSSLCLQLFYFVTSFCALCERIECLHCADLTQDIFRLFIVKLMSLE